MKIQLNIPKNIDKIDKIVKNAIDDTLVELALEGDRILATSLKENVYSYIPKSKNYVRTGRLLKARKTKRYVNKLELESNPKFAGAENNYASQVNNQRFRKAPYFDEFKKDMEKIAQKTFNHNIKKYVNKK